jgi:hypothetical protein
MASISRKAHKTELVDFPRTPLGGLGVTHQRRWQSVKAGAKSLIDTRPI